MKSVSPTASTLLQSGQSSLMELIDLTLATGQVYRFCTGQMPVVAGLWNGSSVGTANTYGTGLTITRGTITQKIGTEAGSVTVTLSPQDDSPFAPVLIAGYPLLQACRYGFLDGATLLLSVLVTQKPSVFTGGQVNVSGGGFPFFLGSVQDPQPDRLSVDLPVADYLTYLSQQQMPRWIFQSGCPHQLYGKGCDPAQTLRAAMSVSGTIATAGDGAHFTTSLTQANGYFNQGSIKFTSGALSGFSQSVRSYVNASGALTVRFPFPVAPSPGDAFTIVPGCDRQVATCNTKFNNLAHYAGFPFVPSPETMLDGGTSTPPRQTIGAQAGQIIGSSNTGARYPAYPGFYQP